MSGLNTSVEWMEVVKGNEERRQFPICFAAADDKHLGIICPKQEGLLFYNCKGFHSIVLKSLLIFIKNL